METEVKDSVVRRVGDEIHLHTKFEHREKARSVPGAKWNPGLRAWVYPCAKEVFTALHSAFGAHAVFEGFDAPSAPKPRSGIEFLKQEVARLQQELEAKTEQNNELHTKQLKIIDRLNEATRNFEREKNSLEMQLA